MATKRKAVNIGTHNGTFHCDEALGCWMLKQTELFAGEWGQVRGVQQQQQQLSGAAKSFAAMPAAAAADCNILRSRDPAVLDDCDVVIDVGGTYEPERNRYDHHQRGFSEVFGHGYNTKLSSAGQPAAVAGEQQHEAPNAVAALSDVAAGARLDGVTTAATHLSRATMPARGVQELQHSAPPLKVPAQWSCLLVCCLCLPLVAAGLVYKHFGREIISRVAKLPRDHPDVETIYLQVCVVVRVCCLCQGAASTQDVCLQRV